jgi:hypothetical protein
MNIYEIEKIWNSIKLIRLFSCKKLRKNGAMKRCIDNRGWTIYKDRRGYKAVKLKDVGNVMLDFLKVPCSIPVNNFSWEKIECSNKIPREIVFYPGKMFPFKKEL